MRCGWSASSSAATAAARCGKLVRAMSAKAACATARYRGSCVLHGRQHRGKIRADIEITGVDRKRAELERLGVRQRAQQKRA